MFVIQIFVLSLAYFVCMTVGMAIAKDGGVRPVYRIIIGFFWPVAMIALAVRLWLSVAFDGAEEDGGRLW